MRLPFDTSTIEFATVSPAELALDSATKAAKTRENGTPLYSVRMRPSEYAASQLFVYKIGYK